MSKNPRGRPQIWPTQIEAPSEALELYRLIASLQNSDAFDTCHVWSGAMNGGQPVIKWQKKNKGVVQVLSGYMGHPASKNLCGTKNCVNPFHYTPYSAPEAQLLPPDALVPAKLITASLDDYMELVTAAIDEHCIKKEAVTFERLRPLLHPDDITDAYLKDCLTQITQKGAK